MDDEDELKKFKLLLGGFAIFLVAGWFALEELRYAAFGQSAQATIEESFETADLGRRGRKRPVRAVRYRFADADGTNRIERDDVPLDWEPPDGAALESGSSVTVQYLSGKADMSRLSGHTRPLPVVIFTTCLVAMAAFSIWLWRHASQAVHGSPRRRRS